jgi:hypothetical protein
VGEDYVWEWRTTHRTGAAAGTQAAETRFIQSTFASAVLSPERFRRGGESYRPGLGPDGEVHAFVLQSMDGSRSVAEIARGLQKRFPDRFREYRDALNRVSALTRELGR